MRKANSEQSNYTKETINYYPFGSEMRMSSPYQIIRKNGITQVDCPAVSLKNVPEDYPSSMNLHIK